MAYAIKTRVYGLCLVYGHFKMHFLEIVSFGAPDTVHLSTSIQTTSDYLGNQVMFLSPTSTAHTAASLKWA